MPFTFKDIFEEKIVFNDTIVDDSDFACLMGVSVLIRWPSMGRPPSMTDPDLTIKGLSPINPSQLCQLPFFSSDLDLALMEDGNACRIISSIFKSFKPLNENFRCLFWPNISNNATHLSTFLTFRFFTVEFHLFTPSFDILLLHPTDGPAPLLEYFL